MFVKCNVSTASTEAKEVGVFDQNPNTSVVLLVDFKSVGHKTWPVLLSQLQALRNNGWLTYYDGNRVVPDPSTIVGTGNTPFELVEANSTNRFVFFDAPLDDISNPHYTAEISYYASTAMGKAIGTIWFFKLSSGQKDTIKKQIQAASDKGIKSRHWDTPAWPISLRDKIWLFLTEHNVDMLNVDDLVSATRWNWKWCAVAGLTLCGNS